MKIASHKIDCLKIAESVMDKHLASHPLNHYAGILSLHGLIRLAQIKKSAKFAKAAKELLRPFYSGEVKSVGGVYSKMYCCGGNASAWLAQVGYAPEILAVLVSHADELMSSHPRDKHGIFGTLKAPEKIWIDSAFAVCPFLVFTGNMTGEKKYYDEACLQMLEMDKLLRNKKTGLYQQSLNFAGPGKLSEDHWSRGNGWGALALAEMIAEMPKAHPKYAAIKKTYLELMEAIVRYQDEKGMWHQEMSEKESYVETSGTGLMLYAIGRGLETGILPQTYTESFLKGIKGCASYIAVDGSVFNTCTGCLCPGDGSKAAYMEKAHKMNDEHAFGPMVLAFGQAALLGIKTIELD